METKSTTTRLVIPTLAQPPWPPYARVGETLASSQRQFPAHAHERQEVLTYVMDGFASYQFEARAPELLRPGSARFLTAPTRVTHRISPGKGGAIRWFNLVIGLPPALPAELRLQASEAPAVPLYEENAYVRPLVGPRSTIASAAGLECREISFSEVSTTFLRVGHDRRGLVYAVVGSGTVDGRGVEGGEAALADGAGGIAIQGTPGFRVIAATAPRPAPPAPG